MSLGTFRKKLVKKIYDCVNENNKNHQTSKNCEFRDTKNYKLHWWMWPPFHKIDINSPYGFRENALKAGRWMPAQ